MLLTITTTHVPATDLGYVLHKHPDRMHRVDMRTGSAVVCYPEASEGQCTAAILLDLNPVQLVRGEGTFLSEYVNDRPYTAGSLMAVALGRAFRSAINGRCADRPELSETAIPLRIEIPVLPCTGGAELIETLFAPLGYAIEATAIPLDPAFPEWGDSRFFHVVLTGEQRVQDALRHLYVLIPAMDKDRHYAINDDEVEKLLAKGDPWLATHPAREVITRRYLLGRRRLVSAALERLREDDAAVEETDDVESDSTAPAPTVPLNAQRMDAVYEAIHAEGGGRVLDLGCGTGRLTERLFRSPAVQRVLAMDVSWTSLQRAARKLHYDSLGEKQRERLELIQGSLLYHDERLRGFDVAAMVEVIEHLDPPRLRACEAVVFGHARPRAVIVTTPNIEYNVVYETLVEGTFRHEDHRFEWTRAAFRAWADRVGENYGYAVRFQAIGDVHPEYGAPTQMAVFRMGERGSS